MATKRHNSKQGQRPKTGPIPDSEKQGTDLVNDFPLGRMNFILMGLGVVIIFIGFALMAGGKPESREVFNPDVYSFRRIYLAPLIVLTGFVFEIYAIMHKPKAKE
jgi:hypothetical protein